MTSALLELAASPLLPVVSLQDLVLQMLRPLGAGQGPGAAVKCLHESMNEALVVKLKLCMPLSGEIFSNSLRRRGCKAGAH